MTVDTFIELIESFVEQIPIDSDRFPGAISMEQDAAYGKAYHSAISFYKKLNNESLKESNDS